MRHMNHPRKLALQAGDLYYETGESCVNGHITKRYTQSGACLDCILAYQNTPRAKALQRKRQIKFNEAKGKERKLRPLTPRSQAIKDGAATYVSTPCKHGHNSPRWTGSATCIECANKIAARVTQRNKQNRANRPKRVKHIIKDYTPASITRQDRESEDFDAMVKRLYKEDHRW